MVPITVATRDETTPRMTLFHASAQQFRSLPQFPVPVQREPAEREGQVAAVVEGEDNQQQQWQVEKAHQQQEVDGVERGPRAPAHTIH